MHGPYSIPLLVGLPLTLLRGLLATSLFAHRSVAGAYDLRATGTVCIESRQRSRTDGLRVDTNGPTRTGVPNGPDVRCLLTSRAAACTGIRARSQARRPETPCIPFGPPYWTRRLLGAPLRGG